MRLADVVAEWGKYRVPQVRVVKAVPGRHGSWSPWMSPAAFDSGDEGKLFSWTNPELDTAAILKQILAGGESQYIAFAVLTTLIAYDARGPSPHLRALWSCVRQALGDGQVVYGRNARRVLPYEGIYSTDWVKRDDWRGAVEAAAVVWREIAERLYLVLWEEDLPGDDPLKKEWAAWLEGERARRHRDMAEHYAQQARFYASLAQEYGRREHPGP